MLGASQSGSPVQSAAAAGARRRRPDRRTPATWPSAASQRIPELTDPALADIVDRHGDGRRRRLAGAHMSRIIAGSRGGRRLTMPPGDRTRPTTDRVREALFSALAAWAGSSAGRRRRRRSRAGRSATCTPAPAPSGWRRPAAARARCCWSRATGVRPRSPGATSTSSGSSAEVRAAGSRRARGSARHAATTSSSPTRRTSCASDAVDQRCAVWSATAGWPPTGWSWSSDPGGRRRRAGRPRSRDLEPHLR